MLSKQVFSLREPYGRNNVDLVRLAVLCGTSQDKKILNDPSGNRRIIPIYVNDINHKAYNEIDKDEVIMAAYHLYKAGYKWELTKEDIAQLKESTEEFERLSKEYELITKYYCIPPPERQQYAEMITATDIEVELFQKTSLKLSAIQIGKELQRIGFIPQSKRYKDGPRKSIYMIERIDPANKLAPAEHIPPFIPPPDEDAPF